MVGCTYRHVVVRLLMGAYVIYSKINDHGRISCVEMHRKCVCVCVCVCVCARACVVFFF